MHLSQSQKISESSFSLLKAKLEMDTQKKRIQQRNPIKINRRKLPSDFFRGSVERSPNKRSSRDPYLSRIKDERSDYLMNLPQTERKIQSYQCLPSSDPSCTNEYQSGKTTILRTKNIGANILHRKLLQNQIQLTKDRINSSKMEKSIDCVKQKLFFEKQIEQKNQNNQDLGSYERRKKLKIMNGFTQAFEGIIDMGCTFGRGFNAPLHLNLKNSKLLKNDTQNNSQYIEEQINQNLTMLQNEANDKKEGYQKSTEQSQILQGLKSNQNSPIQTKNGKKIFVLPDDTPSFQKPKSLSAKKGILRKEFSLLEDKIYQNQKSIFSAERKQRKSRFRSNNSSSDHRQPRVRKDQKIGQLNLPRIGKVVSFQIKDEN